MNKRIDIKGHMLACFTVLVWGLTFVASKLLLANLPPLTIMMIRFAMGVLVTVVMYPHFYKPTSFRQELLFALAGLFGVSAYFLMESFALTMTYASNVSIILCTAPMFTAIGQMIFFKDTKPGINFYIGFVIALSGIILISLNGAKLELDSWGDVLSVLAAIIWGGYNVVLKKIEEYKVPVAVTTRRTFLYGELFFAMCIPFMDFGMSKSAALRFDIWGWLLFLGILASGLCYVAWNISVKRIGVMSTSVYIYAQPVVAVVGSVIILHERFTPLAIIGSLLTIAGLAISEFVGTAKH